MTSSIIFKAFKPLARLLIYISASPYVIQIYGRPSWLSSLFPKNGLFLNFLAEFLNAWNTVGISSVS